MRRWIEAVKGIHKLKYIANHWLLVAASTLVLSPFSFANISFTQNQTEVVIAPTCNHVPISFQYTLDNNDFDESLLSVDSDSDWAIASVNSALNRIDVTFDTGDVIASYTATLTVSHGAQATELFVQATVPPLDVYRLLDDPIRPVTYGIQKNGIEEGSVFAFDPIDESLISCVTVGRSPTDFVINDDSSELLVINSVSQTIDVIDLASFELKETITLPEYNAWGNNGETTANIDLGPNDIVYYTDGNWGPYLRVFDRNRNEILQTLLFNGSSSSNSTGFMDFAVTRDKTRMLAMPQYGWSAGSHSRIIGQYSINPNGTINFVQTTSITNFDRRPFEAPVLLSDDDETVVMKTIAVDSGDIENTLASFPSAIWSMSSNGKVVATSSDLYEFDTGEALYNFANPNTYNSSYVYTKAQAFTSDYSRFIHFNSTIRSLQVVDLISEIGIEVLGLTSSPQNGAVVNSGFDTLSWSPIAGVYQYDVYLGTNEDDVTNADVSSGIYLGRITGLSLELLQALLSGTEYFWRIDPVSAGIPETGPVHSFIVSSIVLSQNEIDEQTVSGFQDYSVTIDLSSQDGSVDWSAVSADDWITIEELSGATPSTLRISLDATELPLGVSKSSITLSNDDGDLDIPVTLRVNPIHLTHIRSDRNSATVYAISEESTGSVSNAYLLEIDSLNESIKRVIPVGSSVTDFTIHYADDLLYVTNWKSGDLLAIDRDTFELQKNIEFAPAGATGYSSGDVFRVAAGVSKRVVVEEEDQWIDISLVNTTSEVEVDATFVREGGGAFGPNGRYYYHGENNSSGASIIKFDTSGDTFTQLAEIRPAQISSYYGSRTVVVSEDGSRIFWAGVVFDNNLESEWATGQIVYSTSPDGRYAFSNDAIYDVNLRRQVFSMPINTSVSGFNSTSEKLIVENGGSLQFYEISPQGAIPTPTLSISDETASSITLNWTDASLEMGFAIQSQTLGASEWQDLHTTGANETSWVVNNLVADTSYVFRIRALTEQRSSSWSNIVYREEGDVIPALELMLSPSNGAVVNSPSSLSWTFIPWIEEYDVYLGTNEEDVANADTSSALYLGRVSGSSFDLPQVLLNNTKYFWRIDPIRESGAETGLVYSFTVSRIALDKSAISERTITGFNDFSIGIQLSSEEASVAWTATSADDWVTLNENAGNTPSTLNMTLDASELPLGENTSFITLTNIDGDLIIPITLYVEPLSLKHIRSDRYSSTVYAISEDTSNSISYAYLLEIDSLTESIKRVIPVGSSVTDFAIHYADDLLYVTNWRTGELLAVDRNTLELQKNIEFRPAGATGYSSGDVYRVAAGVSQRIVVEEEDQWIDISLFDTESEFELDDVGVREGGGDFGPYGRFYYHGENNSSGASLMKFDISGDTFTKLADIRPSEIASYYGSRTVVISEDGSRIFWAGVVFDDDLETEWATGSTVYSTSTDGQYAFTSDAIYDVDLRRQVFTMPTNTTVSGYNSTSGKLIVEVNGGLEFYDMSAQVVMHAPTLTISEVTQSAITLTWVDDFLEMGFVIQRRISGTQTWEDVYIANANMTAWTDNDIEAGVDYEYRIKATADNNNSFWSDVAQTLEQPVANPDSVTMLKLKKHTLNVIANDVNPFGDIDAASVVIVSQPRFGKLSGLTNGEISYTPGGNFSVSDSFSYTVSDSQGQVSNIATVNVVFVPRLYTLLFSK